MLEPAILEKMSQIFKLMSDPTRLSILYHIKDEEFNVTQIGEDLNLEQSVVSHQLSKLKLGGLVKSRREGRNNLYSHDDDHIMTLLDIAIEHAQEIVNI